MIYLVSLTCPAGHPNAGMPREYATADPPRAWFLTLARDLCRAIKEERVPRCVVCGVAFDAHTWGVAVGSMKAQTMDEAKRDLSSVSTPPHG